MGLDKAIKHGNEHRKQYRGVKLYITVCRNHGSCNYCRLNRLHNSRRSLEKKQYGLSKYESNSDE